MSKTEKINHYNLTQFKKDLINFDNYIDILKKEQNNKTKTSNSLKLDINDIQQKTINKIIEIMALLVYKNLYEDDFELKAIKKLI